MKTSKEYDLIIIGAGPAGLTATLYAARYKLNVLVIGELHGGTATKAHKICNFPSTVCITGYYLITFNFNPCRIFAFFTYLCIPFNDGL